LLKAGPQPRTTDATRLPLPQQSERLAMPTDQRCRLNNEQSGFPLKNAGPEDQREASRIRKSSWPDLVLPVEGQLLAKKQILGTPFENGRLTEGTSQHHSPNREGHETPTGST